MSQQNVEVVRRGLEAIARGDLEAIFAACDPAIELQVSDAYFDVPHT